MFQLEQDGKLGQGFCFLQLPLQDGLVGFLKGVLLDARGFREILRLDQFCFRFALGFNYLVHEFPETTGEYKILYIRPEDLYTEADAAKGVPLDPTVVTVEALGPEVVLIASMADGQEVAARLSRGFNAPVSAALKLYADLEMMHVFDADSGTAISHG